MPIAAAIALLALSLTRRLLVQLILIFTSMAMRGFSARVSRHTTMFSSTRTASRTLFYRVPLARAYVVVYGTTDPTVYNHFRLRFATCMLAARGLYLSQPPCTVNTFPFLADIAHVQTTNGSVTTNQMRTSCAPAPRTTTTFNRINNFSHPTPPLRQPLRRDQGVLQAALAASFRGAFDIHMKTWPRPCTFADQ